MPHYVTLMAWQRRDPEFTKMLTWAREEGRWARGLDEVARVDALAAKAKRSGPLPTVSSRFPRHADDRDPEAPIYPESPARMGPG